MKVAVDGRWIFPRLSGIGSYTRELLRHVAALDADMEIVVLFQDPALRDRTWREACLEQAAYLKPLMVPFGVFSPLNQVALPLVLRRAGVDVYHTTNYMMPLPGFPRHEAGPVKCVATIHDVIPLLFREQVGRSWKARCFPVYRWLMAEVAARADMIITDSHASRKDLLKSLPIPAGRERKVRVIYCGVGDAFTPAAEPPRAGAESKSGAGRRLLYVGRSDPYKNLAGLVRALALVRSRGLPDVQLTVAGEPDPRYPEARQLAAELGVASAVRWSGYLSDEALIELYRQSDVLVHASRYEGFGLQVVEAMSCGLPVICSRAGALPEVAGDACLLVDADDVEGFVSRIVEVLTRPELRRSLSARGLERAQQFTWRRTAEATLDVYREAAAC